MTRLRSALQRKALRRLGMRDENVVSVYEILNRPNSPVRLVTELSTTSVDSWLDDRSGLTQPVAHGGMRVFELMEGIVDLKYGAVFLPTGQLIAESTVWEPLRFLMNNPVPPTQGTEEYLEGYSVFPSSSYYHFLLEDLPHVMRILRQYPTRHMICQHNAPAYVVEACLRLTGALDQTPLSHLRVRNYPFISFGSPSGWPIPQTVDLVRRIGKEWSSSHHPQPEQKLYITRLTDSRSPANELGLAEIAEEYGYVQVDAGNLSLGEQVELFGHAKSIVGVHGAGLANAIWMAKGGTVIEIMDPSYYNPCYQWLSTICGHSHTTIVNNYETPQVVNLEAVQEALIPGNSG